MHRFEIVDLSKGDTKWPWASFKVKFCDG